jgi:hypothetical protein
MTDNPSDARPAGRDANGRFAAGNPGRRVGSRNRASHHVVMAMLEDFGRYQGDVLDNMRYMHLPRYFATMARLAPRVLEHCPRENPERGVLSVDDAWQLITRARKALEPSGDPRDLLAALLSVVAEAGPS